MILVVTIYLDAGHGGKDGGAASNGIVEKNIALKIVLKMKKLLEAYVCRVELSREKDEFISLDARTDKANLLKVDCLVSVHVNSASTKSARGFESYRFTGASSATTAFQNIMHREIILAMGTGVVDRDKKSANFHMLRESGMKAILTENLFISNPSDAKLLKDNTFIDKVARGHVNGLKNFFGLKKKKVEVIPKNPLFPTPIGSNKFYKVQVGAFADIKNARGLERDLIKQGFIPFVKKEDRMYKVQLGAFKEKENAEELMKKLFDKGYRPIIKYE